jgi:ribosomal protein S27AE
MLREAVPNSWEYNSDAMTKTNEPPKDGDKCPLCGEGVLAVSSSGRNLVCPKCGRVMILDSHADRPVHTDTAVNMMAMMPRGKPQ